MQHSHRDHPYDDQGNSYPTGHVVSHHSDYPISPSYPNYDTQSQYYNAPQPQSIQEANNPYYRSMTPAHSPPHRYSTTAGRDPRYYNPQGVVSSSSAVLSSVYAPQSQYYNPSYPPVDHRSPASPPPQSHFIPTPSEIAHSYSNYSHHMSIPRSPTVPPPENYRSPSLDYHASSHIPSQHSHSHRPRIMTGRPRTVSSAASTSPISTSSPSGERFPCDKCGKTFSRSHDRKRHHETQHLASPVIHRCRFCEKEFSRADSLKRHLDNGCDEMP